MKTNDNQNIHNSNVQDIFFRNAAASLIDMLNNEVIIELERNGKIEKHPIPFFYNYGRDEGFMKDFFMGLPTDCNYPNQAEGNYEKLPRGIIKFADFSVRTGDITNKFVRGTFNKEVLATNDEKQLKAFSARLYSLPLTLRFTVDIESDNLNKMFKILERILDHYHKNTVKYFQFRGVRIPAGIVFPDTGKVEEKSQFTYADDQNVTTQITIDMETYYPSFDDHSTLYKGNTIGQWNLRKGIEGENGKTGDTFIDEDHPPSE